MLGVVGQSLKTYRTYRKASRKAVLVPEAHVGCELGPGSGQPALRALARGLTSSPWGGRRSRPVVWRSCKQGPNMTLNSLQLASSCPACPTDNRCGLSYFHCQFCLASNMFVLFQFGTSGRGKSQVTVDDPKSQRSRESLRPCVTASLLPTVPDAASVQDG